ncbi:hypothetical protein Klosneuvirus_5_101 [Klosneuvirus KNV1]|uniref:peptidyl-tRNA hydrolase n=1 Tax=Klosneuvirus KNV1 TaxID=1977640 RepID=A0A1V0SL92_9VIRU|nr:hypothetical protein Klosneuvirus_5_101 [Klosneuvirus KNV1]
MNCSIKLADSKQNVCATNSKYDDDYVMYILINENMATNIEKVMTTCCNVISKIIREIESAGKIDGYTNWIDRHEPKIFLKANDEELLRCISLYSNITNKNVWCQYILDVNGNQLSIPAVAFIPMVHKKAPRLIKQMEEFKFAL